MAEKTPQSADSPSNGSDISVMRDDHVNGDIALQAIQGGGDIDLSDASFARVLRKVDLVLLPIMA